LEDAFQGDTDNGASMIRILRRRITDRSGSSGLAVVTGAVAIPNGTPS
jgi:hypothetical protein